MPLRMISVKADIAYAKFLSLTLLVNASMISWSDCTYMGDYILSADVREFE